jgi:hypothetical protein
VLPINNNELVFLTALKPFVSSQSRNLIDTISRLCQDQRHVTMSQQEKRAAMRGFLSDEVSTLLSLYIVTSLLNRKNPLLGAQPSAETDGASPPALPTSSAKQRQKK